MAVEAYRSYRGHSLGSSSPSTSRPVSVRVGRHADWRRLEAPHPDPVAFGARQRDNVDATLRDVMVRVFGYGWD